MVGEPTTENRQQTTGVNWVGLYTFVRSEIIRTFRVVTQTLVTPWISALLFIFIFGSVVGQRIDLIAGVPYINFVLPGILMMNIIASAFAASSSALYFGRFVRSIEEMLVSPFSYLEMIVAFTVSAVVRAVIVGAGIYAIDMLHEKFQIVAHLNPFFYFIDGIRYSMIGVRESNEAVGYLMLFGLILVLGALVHYLFKKGWRLRT